MPTTNEGLALTGTAANLIRDLAALADKLDAKARVDQGQVTLLPTDDDNFTTSSAGDLDHEALSEARILRSANQLLNLA